MTHFGHIIVYLTFFLNSAANGLTPEACVPDAIKFPGIEGRGARVIFPDGRTFEVIGHQHGDRNLQASIVGALASPSVGEKQSLEKARPAMEQLAETLKEYREELHYLENYLSPKDQSILWEEASEKALAKFRPLFDQAFHLRSGPQFDDALILAAGPLLFLEQRQRIPAKTRLLGVENITPDIEKGWRDADELRKDTLTFEQIDKIDPKAFSQVGSLIETWDQWLENAETSKLLRYDSAEIDKAVAKTRANGKVADSLKKRLHAYLFDHQSSAKRDISNVQTMITQGSSGLFLVGRMHLVPTLTLLVERCRDSR